MIRVLKLEWQVNTPMKPPMIPTLIHVLVRLDTSVLTLDHTKKESISVRRKRR